MPKYEAILKETKVAKAVVIPRKTGTGSGHQTPKTGGKKKNRTGSEIEEFQEFKQRM